MAGPRQDVIGIEAMARLLKRLRVQADLTQEALGEASEVHRNQIWRYETKESMASPEIRARLARGLGLTPADFELRLSKERERLLREQSGEDRFEQGAIEGQADEVVERLRPEGEPFQRIRTFVRGELEGENDAGAEFSDDTIDMAAESILFLLESLKRTHDHALDRSG